MYAAGFKIYTFNVMAAVWCGGRVRENENEKGERELTLFCSSRDIKRTSNLSLSLSIRL